MLIIGLAGLAILVTTAWYVVNLFRGLAFGDDGETTLPTDFNEIKAWVTDEEYDRIRQSTPLPELPTKNGESTSATLKPTLDKQKTVGQSEAKPKAAGDLQDDAPIFREAGD